MNPTTYASKRKARRFAVQGIYEWQMSANPSHEIEARTMTTNAMHKVDLVYYHELINQVIRLATELDESIQPFLDREFDAIDQVELAVLRLGAYELKYRIEIPYRVVLDESIELAKHFGGSDSHRYINGVLDQLAKTVRLPEVQA